MAVAIPPLPALRAELAHGLSDASRQAILQALRGGECRVVDLVAESGLSQPNVSKHLRCLRGCGLVESDKRGREVFYTVPAVVQELLTVLDDAAAVLAPRMASCRLTEETMGCCP